jgi:hypothetical protein
MTHVTLLGNLRRILPGKAGHAALTLTSERRRTLVSGARAVRAAVEMYEPCVELDLARLKLIEAEMWIDRAELLKGDS